MPFRLQIPRQIHDAMIAHAQSELPHECCGLLAGNILTGSDAALGRVTERYPLINSAASSVEFLSDPRSMFEAVRAMQRSATEVLAVYHSHPTSVPVPSKKDRERNYSEN